MDRFDDDTLLAELREIRPEPRPEFAAELDEWAAAGFPRRDSRASAGPFAKLADHLRDLRAKSGRQWMVPTVGLAITVLAVAGVVIAVSSNGGSSSDLMTSGTASSESFSGGAVETESTEAGSEEGGEAGGEVKKEAGGKVHGATPPASNGKFEGNFFGESARAARSSRRHRARQARSRAKKPRKPKKKPRSKRNPRSMG